MADIADNANDLTQRNKQHIEQQSTARSCLL